MFSTPAADVSSLRVELRVSRLLHDHPSWVLEGLTNYRAWHADPGAAVVAAAWFGTTDEVGREFATWAVEQCCPRAAALTLDVLAGPMPARSVVWVPNRQHGLLARLEWVPGPLTLPLDDAA